MLPGQLIFGEFLLQRLLSEEPAGAFWRALEVRVGRIVYLHFVPESVMQNEAAVKKLRQRFAAVQTFSHPHVVPVERFVEKSEAGAFFVSRFVEGPLLNEYAAQWTQAEGKFPFNLIFDIFRPIAAALDEAKAHNLLHRNLMPRLIVVSQTEGVQIYGFELPGIIRESLPPSVAADMETVRYLDPEQFLTQQTNPQSDQYAFAMMIAELLANNILYPANSVEEFRTFIKTATPPMLPNYPDCVNATLQRALHRNPTVRLPSCQHLLESLAGLTPAASVAVPVQTPNVQAASLGIPAGLLDDIYTEPSPPSASDEPAEPQEDIVPFKQITSAAQAATAEKIASKIRSERQMKRLFWLWNVLVLIGIVIAVYVFRDHLTLVWKQRVRGEGPVYIDREPSEQNGGINDGSQDEAGADKAKPRKTVVRQRRPRKPKEENFEEVGGDSAFRSVDSSETPDEVRFLGTSGSGKKVVFVVDVSAVMGNGENSVWEHVQKELVFSFKDLNRSQHFQVVYFNDAAAMLPNGDNTDPSDPWIPVSPETLKNSYNFLKTVNSSGLGEPKKAVEKALSLQPDVVFFISDQKSTALTLREIDELRQNAGHAKNSVQINAVEIGEGTEPKLKSPIQTLAQTFHGEYKWINAHVHGLKR